MPSGGIDAFLADLAANTAAKRKSGTATIANTATTVVVAHTLPSAPSVKDINVNLTANLGAVWITAIDATNFTINVATAAAAGNGVVGWSAQV